MVVLLSLFVDKMNIIFLVFLTFLIFFVILIFFKEFKIFKKQDKNIFKNNNKIETKLLKAIKKGGIYSIDAMNRLGDLYLSQKRYEEARILYEKLYESDYLKNKTNSILWNALSKLSLIEEKQGNYDLAIEYIFRAKRVKSYFVYPKSDFLKNVSIILSECYSKKGDKVKAINCLKECLESEDIEEVSKLEIFEQMGKIFLEFGEYKQAIDCFKKSKDSSLEHKNIGTNYFLAMAFVGEKDYFSLSKIIDDKFFLKGVENTLIFGFYALGLNDIKEGRKDDALNKIYKIFNFIIFNIGINDFYEFYYYNFLKYYLLGKFNLFIKDKKEAQFNFEEMVSLFKEISPERYNVFLERINLKFFQLLAYYELAKIFKEEKNIKKFKEEINNASFIINSLKEEEKEIINKKEIGNEGPIIKRINDLKKWKK